MHGRAWNRGNRARRRHESEARSRSSPTGPSGQTRRWCSDEHAGDGGHPRRRHRRTPSLFESFRTDSATTSRHARGPRAWAPVRCLAPVADGRTARPREYQAPAQTLRAKGHRDPSVGIERSILKRARQPWPARHSTFGKEKIVSLEQGQSDGRVASSQMSSRRGRCRSSCGRAACWPGRSCRGGSGRPRSTLATARRVP
jgi:hypothetical protein